MINISSQSVYSQKGEIFPTETTEVFPENLYGMTKYAVENICKIKCKEHNMKLVNVRLGSLASPEFNQRLINRFVEYVLTNQSITVDKGSPKVSFLHTHDAAVALMKLVEKICNKPDLFISNDYSTLNLGNNDFMLVREIAQNVLNAAKKSNITCEPLKTSQKVSNYNNVICSDVLYSLLSWQPEHTMKMMINEIWISKVNNERIK